MTVFKTFWKILNKNKIMVIIYTVILIVFGISNMRTSEKTMNFQAEKPNIVVINHDKETELIKGFRKYLKKNCNVATLENEEVINDALFYREIDYLIDIPENYTQDFMEEKNPELRVKSTGDYQASYSEMIVTKYIQMAQTRLKEVKDEIALVDEVENILKSEAKIEMTSNLNATEMQKTAVYYNFASYSLIACLVFMIGIIVNSFNEERIKKRIIISSQNYKSHNRILLIANCCYSIIMWMLYVAVSLIILKDTMFTLRGLLYIVNSFVFTICITTLSFCIANLVTNKEALSGIANVVSLGSSFLCGAFVPVRWLPDFVVRIAHALPTYYYIDSNEKLSVMEEFTKKTMQPFVINILVLMGFAITFIILTNVITKRKRKIG